VTTEEKYFLPTTDQMNEEKKCGVVPTGEKVPTREPKEKAKEEAGGAKGLKSLLLKEAVEEKEVSS